MLAKMRMLEEQGSAFARKSLQEIGDHGSDGMALHYLPVPSIASDKTEHGSYREGNSPSPTLTTKTILSVPRTKVKFCCCAGGFLHFSRLKTLSLLELIYDGFLAPQESAKCAAQALIWTTACVDVRLAVANEFYGTPYDCVGAFTSRPGPKRQKVS